MAAEPETLALNAKAGASVQDFEVQVYAGCSDQTIQELIDYIASVELSQPVSLNWRAEEGASPSDGR